MNFVCNVWASGDTLSNLRDGMCGAYLICIYLYRKRHLVVVEMPLSLSGSGTVA